MKPRVFGIVLLAEMALLQVIRLPYGLNFEYYAFGDSGGNLALADLLSRGYRPVVDFFIPYGLGSILWTKLWFSLVPLTPLGLQSAVFMLQWVFAWVLARIASAMELGWEGRLLMMVSLPHIAAPTANAPHMWEPVLLGGALLFHLRRQYSRALVMVVLTLAFRQALAFFYGLFLLCRVLAGAAKGELSLKDELLPPVLALFASILAQAACFGLAPLRESLLPWAGARMYKALGFNFLSGLRMLVAPPGCNFNYYLGTHAGAWILASLLLLAGAAAALRRRGPLSARGELVLAALFLHVSFIAAMFGHAWFVVYYFFILIIGAAAVEGLGRPGRAVLLAICLLSATGAKTIGADTLRLWRQGVRSAQTAGLWAPPDLAGEWGEVLGRIAGRRAALVMIFGGAELMFPQFAPTENFTLHGMSSGKRDLSRKLEQLRKAQVIVLHKSYERDLRLTFSPVMDFLDAKTRTEFDGRYFRLLVLR